MTDQERKALTKNTRVTIGSAVSVISAVVLASFWFATDRQQAVGEINANKAAIKVTQDGVDDNSDQIKAIRVEIREGFRELREEIRRR